VNVVPDPLPIEYTVAVGVEGATTGTWTVEERAPVAPVTVMVRAIESPPVVSVASAVPVASVVGCVTWRAPEDAVKVTGTPASTLFEASRASAEMIALVEPSVRIEETPELRVSVDTAVVAAEDVETTCTLTVAVSEPDVAVTVIVRGVASPAVERVAVAAPLESVVEEITAMPPELAANVTGTSATRLWAAFRARTVMVAVVEPSEAMEVAFV